MVAPRPEGVNDDGRAPTGIGGWLLLLVLLLLVGQPVNLAFGASIALEALPIRGVPLGLVILARIFVAAVGVGAGLALVGRRPGAATFAVWSLALSAAMDLFVYLTPFYPSNRLPGTTPIVVAVSLAYHAIWIAYLLRSRRVRAIFGG